MKRITTFGPKQGQCNICGDEGPLTEDHTPPKGATRIGQVEMHHIAELLSAEKAGSKGRISQNGVKFRTLCKRCNNHLLGSNYDIAFNEFSKRVYSYLSSPIELPKVMHIRAKPQKIARALFGHLAAMGINRYPKGSHTAELTEWFLNESKPLPEYLDIHYWIYPYKTQVLVRDAALRNLHAEDTALIWLMKFFPIAFMMVWNKPRGYDYPQFPNFNHWRALGSDEEVEMPIYLDTIPHERWPEAPENQSFLAYGDTAMGVLEKPKRKK